MILAAWRRLVETRALRRHAIPDALWNGVLAAYPFVARRRAEELAALRRLTALFLARKEFDGAGGLTVTDFMAVSIAVQACLPVLHLGLEWYDGFVGIVVHPDEVVARREVVDDSGVVHRFSEVLTGEAMSGGPMMLSWRDVAEAGETAQWGYNVVIHEFAHVIDMRDGLPDGIPPLAGRQAHERWRAVLDAELQAFSRRVERGEDTALDPYGIAGPEEFFAVAVEGFFVSPRAMRAEHERLYALFAEFFRQDPADEAAPAQ
jgi:Mlc titration factor MtfA (ptsG expression regulator)